MENNKERIEGILKRASERKAPSHLSQKVLHAWKEELERPMVIEPLISKPMWILIAAMVGAIFYGVLTSNQESVTASPVTDLLKSMTSMLSFDLTLQPVAIMAMVALAFMILMNILLVTGRISFHRLSAF